MDDHAEAAGGGESGMNRYAGIGAAIGAVRRTGATTVIRRVAIETDAILICHNQKQANEARELGIKQAITADMLAERGIGRSGPVLLDPSAAAELLVEAGGEIDTLSERLRMEKRLRLAAELQAAGEKRRADALQGEVNRLRAIAYPVPLPLSEAAGDGPAMLWWRSAPIEEPPCYIGHPGDSGWPFTAEDEPIWVPMPQVSADSPRRVG